MCIVDRRLEFLATLSDSPDTVEAEEAAVGSLEVAGPSGELQDRPEQQEYQYLGVKTGWKFGWKFCDFLKGVGFIFTWAGGGILCFFLPVLPWQAVVSWILWH